MTLGSSSGLWAEGGERDDGYSIGSHMGGWGMLNQPAEPSSRLPVYAAASMRTPPPS